jgi:hypothetical protein
MSQEKPEPDDRQVYEMFWRNRAGACDKLAAKEHALAEMARTCAQTARTPGHAATLQRLAEIHDDAARQQAETAANYREMADQIAIDHVQS